MAGITLENFRRRVNQWVLACLGREVAEDKTERNHRFLEEALELVQSCGCTQSEAHQLVDYVFDRPIGEKNQELGGTLLTLAALATAHHLNLEDAADGELERVWVKIDQIRSKQLLKPKHTPLPVTP